MQPSPRSTMRFALTSSVAVADYVYIDSSALMRWASAAAGSPAAREQRGRKALEALISGPAELCASPVTVAEYTSTLYDAVRAQEEWAAHFQAEDADRGMEQFMQWLADGAIHIRPLGTRAFEIGLAYVNDLSREGRRMRGWDAIHLYEACRWARELGVQVGLATSDSDFSKVLAQRPAFAAYIEVIDTTA